MERKRHKGLETAVEKKEKMKMRKKEKEREKLAPEGD